MKEQLMAIKEEVNSRLEDIGALKELESFRVEFLGKKGKLTKILKGMGSLSKEERPAMGQIANEVREFIENSIEETKTKFAKKEQIKQMEKERIDVTMPGVKNKAGRKHPLTSALEELENIFIGMGYEIAEGPDVEKDYYNFEALNTPADHPARDEQDTFYVEGIDKFVLRTHTSSVQIREMETGELPIRIICPGKVFRSDEVDATHSPVFHQVEGLVVDEGVTMGDLKGTLEVFAKEVFGEDTIVRFRPHHFPFTEPSAEMDVSCYVCGGTGCGTCKQSGWIEVLGCGMVHPKVLERCGIDPTVYSGFAFGMGLERVALSRHLIPDMRLLYENDVNFLKQFN